MPLGPRHVRHPGRDLQGVGAPDRSGRFVVLGILECAGYSEANVPRILFAGAPRELLSGGCCRVGTTIKKLTESPLAG